MKTAAAASLALILVGACARSEDASERNQRSEVAVEKVRSTDADEQEPAVGEWRMALQEERPALEFGSAGTAPLITFVCGERGGLVMQRAGALAPGAANVNISIAGQGRPVPVTPGTGATPTQNAAIPAGDSLIQQLSAAQTPIALRFGDGTQFILPVSPLIGQFAQTCAGGGAARGAGAAAVPAAAAGNATAMANETNASENKAAPAR
jgi:hypothetical protein